MTDTAPPEGKPALPAFMTENDPRRREEVLHLLRESLAEWETQVDWEGLPERRKQALLELARESAAALRGLIENFERPAGRKG